MKNIKLSVIIPAYNEEKRIYNVINSYISFLDKKYDYELIIVSDGNDNTNKIIENMMVYRDSIRLIELSERQGKGGGIIHGFKCAKGDLIGFIDSDEAIVPEEFDKLINNVEKGMDCAIASRRVEGANIITAQPLYRRLSSKVFNIIVNIMFNIGIKDTQCGAKIFRREIICQIVPLMKTRGFEFDVELLWRIKNKGYKIKEVPIIWRHNGGSTFSLKYSYKMLISLIKIRLQDLINRT